MNKQAARAKALEGALSVGDLRRMIEQTRGSPRPMSNVNKATPLPQALDIYTAALGSRDDAEVPPVLRHDPYRDGMRPTGDALIITNILRDCA
jgi:hypothetical protein